MSDAFLPTHALVTAPDATPTRWMLVLHGILGSGANFRTFIRRVAAARPDWGFVLVDLRMHGASQGAPPPHTVAAAAEDLIRLGARLPAEPAGVLGHSFGGKVALAYAARRAGLDQLWVLDASPSAAPEGLRASSTADVVRFLRDVPETLPSRERFFELCAERGLSRGLAEWLAMNVRREGDAFRLRLDLDAIDALLADYFARDLWPALEDPRFARAAHVVVGGRSDALDAADRARLAELARREPTRVFVHLLAEAGHWVHVDAPDALFDAVAAGLA